MAVTNEGQAKRKLPSLGLIHAIGATALVAVVVALYFGIDRSEPIRFVDGAVSPQSGTVGDGLTVSRSVEWLRFDCTNLVVGYIEDSAGVQDKQVNFSAPTPDREACLARSGGQRCIVNSRSSPPDRGIRIHGGMTPGPASYHVTVAFRCGRLGAVMSPIEVVAPALKFSIR